MYADPWSDDVPVPTFGPRMVCTRCGIIGADARPHWQEQPPREPLTGVQCRLPCICGETPPGRFIVPLASIPRHSWPASTSPPRASTSAPCRADGAPSQPAPGSHRRSFGIRPPCSFPARQGMSAKWEQADMLLEFLENGKSLGELWNAHQLLAHRDHICPSERHDWWRWSRPRRAVWWGLRLWWVRRGISAKLMSVRVWQGIQTILVIAPVWKPRADFGVRLPCQRHVRTKRVQNRDGWLITSSLTRFPSARPNLQARRNTTSVWSSKVIPEPAFTRAPRAPAPPLGCPGS
jgi:hypothetical protein